MAPQESISDQDSWCAFNDCDSAFHNPGNTRPIGIEIYQTVYVWHRPEVEDILFFVYDVKNVSGYTLQNCYVGIRLDCEIGGLGANDFCSCIVERQYVVNGDTIAADNVGYQWQWEEEPGTPPWFPGVIGFDLLQTPFDLVEGMDKDGDGILDQYERDSSYYVNNLPASMWDVDNDGVPDWRDPSQWPKLGMTAFKKFYLSEPETDPERYLTMAGYDYLTGQYEPFDTIIGNPNYWTFWQTSGPIVLLSDSVVTLVAAVTFADWSGWPSMPDTALVLVNQHAEDYYNMYWYIYTGIRENFEFRISDCDINISPNPASNRIGVTYSLKTRTDVSLRLYNVAGQVVREIEDQELISGAYSADIDLRGLPLGTYFIVLETPTDRQSRSFVIVR
jgi:hypothetical protein